MSAPFSNEDEFADGIIDSTLDTLANQKDDVGEDDLHDVVQINPQSFTVLNPDWVALVQNLPRYIWALQHNTGASMSDFGLPTAQQQEHRNLTVDVQFASPFKGIPHIAFGQYGQEIKSDATVYSGAVNYVPFVVQPYVYKWSFANGGLVDGFTLGVYALTSPPPGISAHFISWRAIGNNSRTADQAVTQSWEDPYQQDEPDFLTVDTGDVGDEGDDLLVDS